MTVKALFLGVISLIVVGVLVYPARQCIGGNVGAIEPTQQVTIGAAFQVGPNSHWILAFVETGSADKRVHVSLNEAACHQTKTDYHIRHISAAHRKMNGRDGIRIGVLLDHEVPSDMGLLVTITHLGATHFGRPEKWTGAL